MPNDDTCKQRTIGNGQYPYKIREHEWRQRWGPGWGNAPKPDGYYCIHCLDTNTEGHYR